MKKARTGKSSFGKGDWRSYFRLIPYVRMPWLLVAVAFVVNLGYSEVMAYVPVSTSALFSGEFTGSALASAVIYNVLNYALMFGSLILQSWVSYVAIRRAQEILWGRMLRLDMAYYDSHDPSDIMSTLTSDTETAINSLITQLVSLIPTIYYLVRVCMTLSGYDFRLLLSMLILVPVNIVYVVIIGRWQYEANAGIYGRVGRLTAYLAERVSNIFLIRAYTNEEQEERNGLEASKQLYSARLRLARVNMAGDMAASVMEIIQHAVPILFGTYLLSSGAITMEQWIAFFLFIGQVITRVKSAASTWTGIKAAQGCSARMIGIFTAPEEKGVDGGAGERDVKPGDIEFRDVSFAYGDKEVLHGINVTIPAGKTTALVGRCGSGKTTMLSLIERLYTPSAGSITLAGRDVSEYDLRSYRDHFAYVQQDAGIFGGTLRSAMTYGIKREVGDAELTDAAGRTGILPLVNSLPEGLDAPLAISGGSVSGGQRQRLVLTRELIKGRSCMLLDEPTSALDAQSAMSIQSKLLELFEGTTKVMITHDLRLLSRVDNVIFLENGRVLDSGAPAELMARCEGYRSLVLCGKEDRG